MRQRRSMTATAAAAVLLLSACSGGTDADGDTAEGGDATEERSQFDGPLSTFLGIDENTFGFGDTDQQTQLQVEVEQGIRDCMAEEGFEYFPEDVGEAGGFIDFSAQLEDPVGFARENGLGMTTSDDFFGGNGNGDENPNFVYVESLDEAAQAAYQVALYGDFSAFDEFDAEAGDDEDVFLEEDFNPGGCQFTVSEEVYGDVTGFDEELFASEAFQRFEELASGTFEEIEDDPDVVAAREEYATCMSERGYPDVSGEEDVFEAVNDRINTVFEDLEPLPDEGDEPQVGGFQPPDIDPEALAELRSFEIDIAVASAECGTALRRAQLDAQFAAEQAIIDDPANADLLAEVKAAFESMT